MRIEENEGGGQSVIVEPGDNLANVPKSHRMLITAPLREAFADPVAHFLGAAGRCPFPSMAAWLRSLVAGGQWDLALHQGDPEEWTAAGIRWLSDDVVRAEITPADESPADDLPPVLRQYYSLVDTVSWLPFGYAGGLSGSGPHMQLSEFYYTENGAQVDPDRTYVLGGSPAGDLLIYTDDDRGGWWSHENGTVHLLGTIDQTIEWVYAELLSGNLPDFGGLAQ